MPAFWLRQKVIILKFGKNFLNLSGMPDFCCKTSLQKIGRPWKIKGDENISIDIAGLINSMNDLSSFVSFGAQYRGTVI